MTAKKPRNRMTGTERREQLIEVARGIFADRGFDGTAIEEVAHQAGVSKPVVYEHFGGKEGLYAVVIDREVNKLLTAMRGALTADGGSRELVENATVALLDYIESSPDGFRILVRDIPIRGAGATYQSMIGDIATRVEGILADRFKEHGLNSRTAPMYAQMLVGMVVMVGQWWLGARKPAKEIVAAHLVNLAWHGLEGLEVSPQLRGRP